MGNELWCGQAQNGVNSEFEVKFDLEGQGQSPPKTIGTLTQLFCIFFSNLVVLAWTRDELWCGQARGLTDTHTDRQTQATTIPEGQNWPRVKMCRKIHYSPCGFREDTAPKQLTNHNARNLSLVETESLSGGLCGRQDLPYRYVWPLRVTDICVTIYRCHLLYARKYWFALLLLLLLLLWHICISDGTSSLVWPLPGTIPQFRDNLVSMNPVVGKPDLLMFTIKHNETNVLSSDGRNIVKHPRMLSTQSVALYNLVNLNLDYQRIYTSLGLNELRSRKIMNCQSPGDFLIKLVFQIFNLKGE